LIAFLIAAALGLAIAAPVAAVDDPFLGRWTAVDNDGSNMTLQIAGHYQLVLYDDGASVCGVFDENGDPTVAAIVKGTGSATGEVLSVSFTGRCLTGGGATFSNSYTFTYDPGTDTLTDGTAVIWYRA
jgi:hypothetical protein